MKRTHLEIKNSDDEYQAACGAYTPRTTSVVRNVDCEKCLRWFAARSPAVPSPSNTGEKP